MVFDEKPVVFFLDEMIRQLQELKTNVKGTFPADVWIHTKGGNFRKKPLFWSISLMLVTNPSMINSYVEEFRNWTKQVLGATVIDEKRGDVD